MQGEAGMVPAWQPRFHKSHPGPSPPPRSLLPGAVAAPFPPKALPAMERMPRVFAGQAGPKGSVVSPATRLSFPTAKFEQ